MKGKPVRHLCKIKLPSKLKESRGKGKNDGKMKKSYLFPVPYWSATEIGGEGEKDGSERGPFPRRPGRGSCLGAGARYALRGGIFFQAKRGEKGGPILLQTGMLPFGRKREAGGNFTHVARVKKNT